MSNIVEVLGKITFGELLASENIKMINAARLYFETTEEFEKCALLRDKLVELKVENVRKSNIIGVSK